MKKEVLYLVLYAIAVVFLMYCSLRNDYPIMRRILDEVFAIYFAIRFYETCKGLINKEK